MLQQVIRMQILGVSSVDGTEEGNMTAPSTELYAQVSNFMQSPHLMSIIFYTILASNVPVLAGN